MIRNVDLPRHAARAAVVLLVSGVMSSTGVAFAEPDNGSGDVTVGETFRIWLRNPQQSSGQCWQAAQDHNKAINSGDYAGIADALDRVERYDCDVVPI
jgi:hypothetical protein